LADIDPGELLFQIPAQLILSPFTHYSDLRPLFLTPFESCGENSLLKMGSGRLELAVTLLWSAFKGNTELQPYLDILPTYSEQKWHNPICWDDDLVDMLLKGTNIYLAIPHRREMMQNERNYLIRQCQNLLFKEFVTWYGFYDIHIINLFLNFMKGNAMSGLILLLPLGHFLSNAATKRRRLLTTR
jgi:hypothetical protein